MSTFLVKSLITCFDFSKHLSHLPYADICTSQGIYGPIREPCVTTNRESLISNIEKYKSGGKLYKKVILKNYQAPYEIVPVVSIPSFYFLFVIIRYKIGVSINMHKVNGCTLLSPLLNMLLKDEMVLRGHQVSSR